MSVELWDACTVRRGCDGAVTLTVGAGMILWTCNCCPAASTTSTIVPAASGGAAGPPGVADRTSVAPAEGAHNETGGGQAAAPNPEDISLGDSAGSEYETVSFTEETG